MNTVIDYLYRDASNYKIWQSCIINGELTEDQKSDIVESLIDQEYFIPEMVGLPGQTFADLGYRSYDDDPEYFEFVDFDTTENDAEVDITPFELVERFQKSRESQWIVR